MEELANLLAAIVSPGKDWGTFSRKVLSTLLVASSELMASAATNT